jgi:hypothetical protein
MVLLCEKLGFTSRRRHTDWGQMRGDMWNGRQFWLCAKRHDVMTYRGMEVTCSSKTSVDLQRTTRRYIPEVSTLQYYNWLFGYFITLNFQISPPVNLTPFRIQSTYPISYLILSFHLCRDVPSDLFPSGFPARALYALSLPCVLYALPFHLP